MFTVSSRWCVLGSIELFDTSLPSEFSLLQFDLSESRGRDTNQQVK